jgi:hypothetical protein
LTAAGLKAWQHLFDPGSVAIQGGILASKWAAIGVIEVEMLLGICLIMNLWRRATWTVTLLLFAAFSVYSGTRALEGEPCGCFGSVGNDFPSWATLIFDLAAISALWVFRASVATTDHSTPNPDARPYPGSNRLKVIANGMSLLMVIILGAAVAVHNPTTDVVQPGLQIIDHRYALAEASEWTGRRFPLLDYTDIGHHLIRGEWWVLLYDHDCSICQTVLKELESGGPVSEWETERGVATIDLSSSSSSVPIRLAAVQGRLRGRLDWIMETPQWIQINDGIVSKVKRSITSH